MPNLTQAEIRDRAFAFVKEWEGVTSEKAEAQTFWNEFFNIFGISRRRIASFEEPVKKLGDKKGSIDLLWKGTLLVEHKTTGKSLESAYQQALDYFPGLKENELPQYVLVSDFNNFRLHDLDNNTEIDFALEELPDTLHNFGFISGYTQKVYHDEDPVNVQVAEKMGELHDELLSSGYAGHNLEVFLVRLIYCLFADDTGIFPKDHFHYFIESRTNNNGTDTGAIITTIFQICNTPESNRQISIDEEYLQFPYVNGHLFEEPLPIPIFTSNMRSILLDCCSFNWSKVSPAIFGAMFQSVMDKEQRRNLGAHYTSEKNILKVVRGLFLDELRDQFSKIYFDANKLIQFHEKLSKMVFFDPACGCGNFLVITYREIRKLEIEVISQLEKLRKQGARQLLLNASELSKIDVDSLYGIEIEEFPSKIAEVAIWLTDHQMNMALSREFGLTYSRLPLRKSAHILRGNALQTDWQEFLNHEVKNNKKIFILGNPPFVGKKMRSVEQNNDMDFVFSGLNGYGVLDYVSCWYLKACKFLTVPETEVAFVSTNSITQGEQVIVLWKYLLTYEVVINFAHRTFKWTNEAPGQAAVFCVIIGYSKLNKPEKQIFDYAKPNSDPMSFPVKTINPYLIEAEPIFIKSRTNPISPVPNMAFGNMPNDDGNFLLNLEEKNDLIMKDPGAEMFIKPYIDASSFLHGEKKFCIWLKDTDPTLVRNCKEIMRRVENVRQYRHNSTREATRQLALYPTQFGEIRQPESPYLLIPRHSSENRKYIPFAFFDSSTIVNDSCATISNCSLYHFGVLQSLMHMTWVKLTCGRIKGDFRYSNNIVYNNFPWPINCNEKRKKNIISASEKVLIVRENFKNSSLADLYDPNVMPKSLVVAHKELDDMVDRCYRDKSFSSELERLSYLFSLYKKITEPLLIKQKK